MKLYENGLLIGRFQMLHKGHEEMIKKALNLCNHVTVFIGSAQEYGTERNPFSYKVREGMFNEVFKGDILSGRLTVLPLDDIEVGNNSKWGDYVISEYKQHFYSLPDIYFTGCEKERASWFSGTEADNKVDELWIGRKTVMVSGTECREALKKGDENLWRSMVPYQLYTNFNYYKTQIDKVKGDK